LQPIVGASVSFGWLAIVLGAILHENMFIYASQSLFNQTYAVTWLHLKAISKFDIYW